MPSSCSRSPSCLVSPGSAQIRTEPPLRADWCLTDDPAAFIALARRAETIDEAALCAQVGTETPSGETLPDMLALPLPCGHRMLFRKVRVPADYLLDQRVAAFGSSGGGTVNAAFARGPWDAPISGVFSEDEDARPIVSDPGRGERAQLLYRKVRADRVAVRPIRRRTVRFGQGPVGRCTGMHDREAADGFRLAGQHPAHDRAELVRCHRLLPRLQCVAVLTGPRIAREGRTCSSPSLGAGLKRLRALGHGGGMGVRRTRRRDRSAAGGSEPAATQGARSRQRRRPRRQDSTRWRWCSSRRAPGSRRSGGWERGCRTFWACTTSIGNVEELILELFRATRPDTLHGHAGGVLTRGGSALTSDAVDWDRVPARAAPVRPSDR